MKASVQFREEKPPLFRLKLPVRLLGLPFFSGATMSSSPNDLALLFGTALPAGPSVRLAYRPLPAPWGSSGLTFTASSSPPTPVRPHSKPVRPSDAHASPANARIVASSGSPVEEDVTAGGGALGPGGGSSGGELRVILKAGLGCLGSPRDTLLALTAELQFLPCRPPALRFALKANPRWGDLGLSCAPSALFVPPALKNQAAVAGRNDAASPDGREAGRTGDSPGGSEGSSSESSGERAGAVRMAAVVPENATMAVGGGRRRKRSRGEI